MRVVLFLLALAGFSLAQENLRDVQDVLNEYRAKHVDDPITDEDSNLRDYLRILLYKFDLQKIYNTTFHYFNNSQPFGDLLRNVIKSPTCHKMCRELMKMKSFKAQRSWLESKDVDVETGYKIIKNDIENNLEHANGLDPKPVKDLWRELLPYLTSGRVLDAVEQFRNENVDFEEFYQRIQFNSMEMKEMRDEITQLHIWPVFKSSFLDIGTNFDDMKEIWSMGATLVLSMGNIGC